MSALTQETCEACRADAPQVTDAEIEQLKPQVPEWDLLERDDVRQLERAFKVKNFQQALDFTNRVGELAEAQGHHPALLTEWGRVTVTWWTHKIGGLHRNDFVMAAKTDEIYQSEFAS